ncbi:MULTISPECIES: phosphatase PAP2 family protein [Methylorubrum]|uniref:phosphatase PAP2 family protein n=1 Tax=Methylorubrum TaxID=2282523 RepID=UPI002646D199|nr:MULTISPECIES: phosphatase PAP2 family protein [Methylorubrum]
MLAKTPRRSIHARATRVAAGIEVADVASGVSLARAKDHPAVQAMGSASEIGSWQALFALSATALALGMVARDRRLARAGQNMLAAGIVASLVKTTIKRTVHRTRPNVFMDEGLYSRGRPGTGDGPWQSFPSGHAALSVAVARSVARAYPGFAAPAYCAAAAIATTQVVRGAHFPADVMAGAVIGIAAEAVSHRPFTDEARRHG